MEEARNGTISLLFHCSLLILSLKDVRRFFLINARKRSTKILLKMRAPWTAFRVLHELRKQEIREYVAAASGYKPGSRDFLRVYHPEANKYLKSLPASVLQDAEKKAEEWETNGPPQEIQQ